MSAEEDLLLPGKYSSSPVLTTANPSRVEVLYKAKLYEDCCCYNFYNLLFCVDTTTLGITVLENSVEYYNGYSSCCCGIGTRTSKIFYDEHPFSITKLNRYVCCFTGHTRTYGKSVERVCLCMDTPEWFNNLCECYSPTICGDRVSVTLGDSYCLCCSLVATPWTNFYGLCGPKTGQPLLKHTIFSCLKPGTGHKFAEHVDNARQKFRERVGIKD